MRGSDETEDLRLARRRTALAACVAGEMGLGQSKPLCRLRGMQRPLFVALAALLVMSCKDRGGTSPLPGTTASSVGMPPAAPAVSSVVAPASSLALPAEDMLPALSPPPAVSVAPSAGASAGAPPKTASKSSASASPAAQPPPPPSASAAASLHAAGSSAPAAASSTLAPLAPDVMAGDPAANALAERVDTFYMARKSLTVRFKQEFYVQSTGKRKASSGTMKFLRPGRMVWRYDPPNTNLVVCDGATVTVYDGEANQYTRQPFQNSEYAGALGFLSGDGIRKYFSFRFHDVTNFPGGKVLYGTPRTRNPGYDVVLFYVDEATAHIRRVMIIDAQRNRNRFDLESLSESPIDPGEFMWTPPAGATLIAN
jgi:outer membrane lipoprotein carrier protein